MALITCPDCGKPDVSSRAPYCPNCGAPIAAEVAEPHGIRPKENPNSPEIREGIRYLEESIIEGGTEGFVDYVKSKGVDCLTQWKEAASIGNPDALCLMGMSCLTADRFDNGFELLQLAIDQGHALSEVIYACSLLTGNGGLKIDKRKGFNYLESAERKGCMLAKVVRKRF